MELRNKILSHKDTEKNLFVRIVYRSTYMYNMYVAVVDIIENTVKYITCTHTQKHMHSYVHVCVTRRKVKFPCPGNV